MPRGQFEDLARTVLEPVGKHEGESSVPQKAYNGQARDSRIYADSDGQRRAKCRS
jgi:hypothetical protein